MNYKSRVTVDAANLHPIDNLVFSGAGPERASMWPLHAIPVLARKLSKFTFQIAGGSKMKSSIARIAGLVAIFLCGNALATIVGTFNIAGGMTFTPTTITWTNNVPPNAANQANIGPGGTGIYSSLGGTTVTIHSLNQATEPVGSLFPAQSLISFDANPSLSSLLINFIFAGIYSSAQCATTPAAVGQTCTPSAGSPFNFVNNPPPPPTGPQATMTLAAQGLTGDGLDTWFGNFTSQFSVPYQTVLAAFAPGGSGSVTTSYSATITVQTASTSVPEPSTVLLVVFALMSMALFVRRLGV